MSVEISFIPYLHNYYIFDHVEALRKVKQNIWEKKNNCSEVQSPRKNLQEVKIIIEKNYFLSLATEMHDLFPGLLFV